MGRPHVRDQGLTSLVLQLLKGGSTDVDGQAFGPGFQVAGAFSLQAEHNLSHAGISFFAAPSLAFRVVLVGACGYGEPALRAPQAPANPTLTLPKSLARDHRSRCASRRCECIEWLMNNQVNAMAQRVRHR